MHETRFECERDIAEYVQRKTFVQANLVQDNYDTKRKRYYDRDRLESEFDICEHVTVYQLSHLVGHQKKMNPAWNRIWKSIKKFISNAVQI